MNYMLEAKTAKEKAFNKAMSSRKRSEKVVTAMDKLRANKKKAYIGSGIAGGAAVAGGASAAVLAKKAKQYAAAAAKEKDPRAKKIYEAKAAKYKKLAIAAGASAGAVGAAAGGTALVTKNAGNIRDKAARNINQQNEIISKLNESYADGYYAALCEIEALEESYDDCDEYDY